MEPTDEQIAKAVEKYRPPTTTEIKALLGRFFVGAIDDTIVSRLDQQLADVLADKHARVATSSAFEANGRHYFGQAWKELLSYHDNAPTPTELAIWLAVVTPGYPKPRPYCPEPIVGTWAQVAPTAATWQLRADGAMTTTAPSFEARTRWCLHRLNGETTDLAKGNLWFTSDSLVLPDTLSLREITPTTIRAVRNGLDGPIPYRLERQ